MIQGINNIKAVSKYETKLLVRSWFFKIFSIIVLIVSPIVCGVILFGGNQALVSISSVIPYSMMLILNVGQAIVSIFLSSEYLKRDKQLDTSEVFYTRPLSNAEYLLGKMWATLRVFFILDIIVLVISLIMCLIKLGFDVDYLSFIWYFLLLSVPTLVFITGLSTTLMLIIKNQALTLVVLLAYIGVTLFYIDDLYYYLFDYIGFNLPMLKSTITGFGNLPELITHRLCYLFLGIGFVLISISLFRRLPNSTYSLLPWRIMALSFVLLGLFLGYKHVENYTSGEKYRNHLIELNNIHVHDPKMEVDTCRLNVNQQGEILSIVANMDAKPIIAGQRFTFCLNPGFVVNEVSSNGKSLSFQREEQLLMIDFGRGLKSGETINLEIKYSGKADSRICFLDISKDMLGENVKVMNMLNVCKQYAFQTSKYVLLTPESYWYPRPGVCYSDESPDWQLSYFSNFQTSVSPNPGLTPLSQGERILNSDSVSVSFKSELPLQSVSLIIGDYISNSIVVDDTKYSIWRMADNDVDFALFDSIKDTIPTIIRDVRRDYEYNIGLTYPFSRFSFVEVPAHFATYPRAWTKAQEVMQPEMVFIAEKGYNQRQLDFKTQMKWMADDQTSKREQISSIMINALYFMYSKESDYSYQGGRGGSYSLTAKGNPYYIFPQMYNFKYNVYSSRWPIANRMIELFVQQSDEREDAWLRSVNGLTGKEKSLLLMQKNSFSELLSDPERKDLLDNIISLKSTTLFSEAQQKMGVEAFHDSLFNIVKSKEFSNLSFEELLDSMEVISGVDIVSKIEDLDKPIKLSQFSIGTPMVTNVVNEKEDIYQAEITIDNISDVPGYLSLELIFWNGDGASVSGEAKPTKWVVRLEAHQAKRFVSHWNSAPNSFTVNTLLSSNLPQLVAANVSSTITSPILTPEGEYIVPSGKQFIDGEIIVDNEDENLFELSVPSQTGYLTKWIDNSNKDEEFKYSGRSDWRAPYKWTAVTDGGYYGLSIRSAYIIRSGDGTQYAKWLVPITDAGTYDVYYHMRKPNMDRMNNRRWNQGGNNRNGKRVEYVYNFEISQFNISERVSLNLRRVDNGWNQLGTFRFEADTVNVILNDKTGMNMIEADAVKFIRR